MIRSVRACLEISAIRKVWAAASCTIVQRKMALVWSRRAMVPLGRAESWPFLCLFEHRVRDLCACERLRTIAAVFYLSFLLFSVVVVSFLPSKCEKCWAGEEHWFSGLRSLLRGFLTQGVHIELDTLLAKAPSFVDNCHSDSLLDISCWANERSKFRCWLFYYLSYKKILMRGCKTESVKKKTVSTCVCEKRRREE